METIKVATLKSGYSLFGNKGAVWGNKCHITKAGTNITMCGLPMLSSNHAVIEHVKEIGCEKCIELYNQQT